MLLPSADEYWQRFQNSDILAGFCIDRFLNNSYVRFIDKTVYNSEAKDACFITHYMYIKTQSKSVNIMYFIAKNIMKIRPCMVNLSL